MHAYTDTERASESEATRKWTEKKTLDDEDGANEKKKCTRWNYRVAAYGFASLFLDLIPQSIPRFLLCFRLFFFLCFFGAALSFIE